MTLIAPPMVDHADLIPMSSPLGIDIARPLTIIQVGNFSPPHSTENHLKRALENNGHTVIALQENKPETFRSMAAGGPVKPDFVLWTRTGWDWATIFPGGEHEALGLQRSMLRFFREHGVPTVGYHLDRWWGLNREYQLDVEPFFSCDYVITADGGHQTEFEGKGVNHHWFLPGVSRDECEPGTFRPEFYSRIAFVGSWQGHYHKESEHRHQLVEWLRKTYPRDCAFWPRQGQHAIRGADLRDLYASVEVIVGDSCFSGDDIGAYCSDRIPETLGRGGYLLHPRTPYVTDGQSTPVGPAWREGDHLGCWNAFNWDHLGATIDGSLSLPTGALRAITQAGREFTLEWHTYERRMQQVVQLLESEGKL